MSEPLRLRPLLILLLVLLGLAAPLAAAPAAPEDLVQRLQNKYQQLRSLEFDFAQATRTGGRTRQGSGNAVFYRPGGTAPEGNGVIRWNYTEPSEQTIVNDGRELSVYTPRDRQLLVAQRVQALADDHLGLPPVQPALLDERHEQWTGLAVDPAVRSHRVQPLRVDPGIDGGARADEADPALAADRCRPGHGRVDDVDDPLGVVAAQQGGGHARRRVAGDDDQPRTLAEQELGVAVGVLGDHGRAFRAVGHAGEVAEIDQRVAGTELFNRPGDGHAADTGVKDTDHREGPAELRAERGAAVGSAGRRR